MPPKSKVRIPLTRGSLAVHDKKGQVIHEYHIRDSNITRHRVLNQIVQHRQGDAIGVYRALLARRTLGKHRLSTQFKDTLTKDANYIKKKYYDTKLWAKAKKSVSYDDNESSSSDDE